MENYCQAHGWEIHGDVLQKDFSGVVCHPSDLCVYGRVVDTESIYDDGLRCGQSHVVGAVKRDGSIKAVPDNYQFEFYARIKMPNSARVCLPKALFEDSARLDAIDQMLTIAFQNDPDAIRDIAQLKIVQQPVIMSSLKSHCDDDVQEIRTIPNQTSARGEFASSRFYLMSNLGGTHVVSHDAPNGRSHRCHADDIILFSGDTYHSVYTAGLPEQGRICFRLGFRTPDIRWLDSLDRQDLFCETGPCPITIITPDDQKGVWTPDLIPQS